jgi:hypothetical protein
VQKILKDVPIKAAAVVSDLFGTSGRATPNVLADLARGSLRGRKAALTETPTGQFERAAVRPDPDTYRSDRGSDSESRVSASLAPWQLRGSSSTGRSALLVAVGSGSVWVRVARGVLHRVDVVVD